MQVTGMAESYQIQVVEKKRISGFGVVVVL